MPERLPLADDARDVSLYRALLLFVGGIYLLWWFSVYFLLPGDFNPLGSRLAVIAFIWGVAAASYASTWIRHNLRVGWSVSLWLITAHYFYLLYCNAGSINWIVGSFITVSAVCLAFVSRASLLSYTLFATALSVGATVLLPELRTSVFLPGLLTVLLQANIGLHSRLKIIKDLATSNEHFQRLFNATFEGILLHREGRIVQVNDALVGMLAAPREELIGRELLDLVHPDERARLEKRLALGGPLPHQAKSVRKDGTAVDVEVRDKAFTEGARPTRLVTFQDVTERNRQAEALWQSTEALERSNIELQRFAYVASHDLQTPLRGIASFVDLLSVSYGDQLDDQGRDWLRRAGVSVTQLQVLIQDLLDYARIDAQAKPFESVSMRDVLQSSLSLLEASILETGAQIAVGKQPVVTGDRSQLVQVMTNLVENAIKYRGNVVPNVEITAEDIGGEWRFVVKDNGIGIAPKHHERIFEIFKRLHDAKEYPGSGIGLAICRRIVERHGGRISVESEFGAGSSFLFTLAKGAEGAND